MNNNKIICVSSYPKKNNIHGYSTVGVASYTKNTLQELMKIDHDLDITVYAEKLENEPDVSDNGIKVVRIWKRNNLFSLAKLFLQVARQNIETVIAPFEFYMYGGMLEAGLFLISIGLYQISNKKVFVILHQVVEDFSPLENNRTISLFKNCLKDIFYFFIVMFSYRVIVFEDKFKRTLHNNNKVQIVPHALQNFPLFDKNKARKKLGLQTDRRYVLYFGYLSPYKGIDALTDLWMEDGKFQLIIAGGANPNHIKNDHYAGFTQEVIEKARQKNIITTGFVDEADIPLYFSACDMVIFPYKVFMSSSGPLSIAFAFEKPVLFSQPLQDYLQSPDMKSAIRQSGLKENELFFDFNKNDLYEKMDNVLLHHDRFQHFSGIMKQERNWEKIALQYYQTLAWDYEKVYL